MSQHGIWYCVFWSMQQRPCSFLGSQTIQTLLNELNVKAFLYQFGIQLAGLICFNIRLSRRQHITCMIATFKTKTNLQKMFIDLDRLTGEGTLWRQNFRSRIWKPVFMVSFPFWPRLQFLKNSKCRKCELCVTWHSVLNINNWIKF